MNEGRSLRGKIRAERSEVSQVPVQRGCRSEENRRARCEGVNIYTYNPLFFVVSSFVDIVL